jgi:hypothetical protein
MNPEIKEYYRAKAGEAEQNAAKASTPADRESWTKIARGYRVLTGENSSSLFHEPQVFERSIT